MHISHKVGGPITSNQAPKSNSSSRSISPSSVDSTLFSGTVEQRAKVDNAIELINEHAVNKGQIKQKMKAFIEKLNADKIPGYAALGYVISLGNIEAANYLINEFFTSAEIIHTGIIQVDVINFGNQQVQDVINAIGGCVNKNDSKMLEVSKKMKVLTQKPKEIKDKVYTILGYAFSKGYTEVVNYLFKEFFTPSKVKDYKLTDNDVNQVGEQMQDVIIAIDNFNKAQGKPKIDQTMNNLVKSKGLNIIGTQGYTVLGYAIFKEYIDVVRYLFKEFYTPSKIKNDNLLKDIVNKADGHGSTVLHYALQTVSPSEIVTSLYSLVAPNHWEADIFSSNGEGKSALDIVAEKDYKPEMIYLYETVNMVGNAPATDNKIKKSIKIAIKVQAKVFLKSLIKANIPTINEFLRCLDDSENSALHEAAKQNKEDVIGILIDSLKIDQQNKRGETFMHVALQHNAIGLIEFAIELGSFKKPPKLGVLLSIPDNQGQMPLHLAVIHGHLNLISKLKTEENVNKPDRYGKTALNYYCEKVSSVELPSIDDLITPKNINEPRDNPPLQNALLRPEVDIRDELVVKLLADKNIDINFKNEDGKTALHLAVSSGSLSTTKLILNNPQFKLLYTKDQQDYLHLAIDEYSKNNRTEQEKQEFLKIIEILSKKYIADQKNPKMSAALERADKLKQAPVVIQLLKHFPKSVKILHMAIKYGAFEFLKEKIEDFKYEINESHEGKVSLEVACEFYHLQICLFLIENGAKAGAKIDFLHVACKNINIGAASQEDHVKLFEKLVARASEETLNKKDDNQKIAVELLPKDSAVDGVYALLEGKRLNFAISSYDFPTVQDVLGKPRFKLSLMNDQVDYLSLAIRQYSECFEKDPTKERNFLDIIGALAQKYLTDNPGEEVETALEKVLAFAFNLKQNAAICKLLDCFPKNHNTLHMAIKFGAFDFLEQEILNFKNWINEGISGWDFPLDVACKSSNPKISTLLIKHGAKSNTGMHLHEACKYIQLPLETDEEYKVFFDLLVASHPEALNKKNDDQKIPAELLSEDSSVDDIYVFLEKKRLNWAVSSCDFSTVQDILSKPRFKLGLMEGQNDFLQLAINQYDTRNKIEKQKYFLIMGALVDKYRSERKNKEIKEALKQAKSLKQDDVVCKLLERFPKDQQTLHMAIELNFFNYLEEKIEEFKSEINTPNQDGLAALDVACKYHPKIGVFLIQHGAIPSQETYLHEACKNFNETMASDKEHMKFFKALVELQPDVVCREDDNGKIPASYLPSISSTGQIYLFLDKEGKEFIKANKEKSPPATPSRASSSLEDEVKEDSERSIDVSQSSAHSQSGKKEVSRNASGHDSFDAPINPQNFLKTYEKLSRRGIDHSSIITKIENLVGDNASAEQKKYILTAVAWLVEFKNARAGWFKKSNQRTALRKLAEHINKSHLSSIKISKQDMFNDLISLAKNKSRIWLKTIPYSLNRFCKEHKNEIYEIYINSNKSSFSDKTAKFFKKRFKPDDPILPSSERGADSKIASPTVVSTNSSGNRSPSLSPRSGSASRRSPELPPAPVPSTDVIAAAIAVAGQEALKQQVAGRPPSPPAAPAAAPIVAPAAPIVAPAAPPVAPAAPPVAPIAQEGRDALTARIQSGKFNLKKVQDKQKTNENVSAAKPAADELAASVGGVKLKKSSERQNSNNPVAQQIPAVSAAEPADQMTKLRAQIRVAKVGDKQKINGTVGVTQPVAQMSVNAVKPATTLEDELAAKFKKPSGGQSPNNPAAQQIMPASLDVPSAASHAMPTEPSAPSPVAAPAMAPPAAPPIAPPAAPPIAAPPAAPVAPPAAPVAPPAAPPASAVSGASGKRGALLAEIQKGTKLKKVVSTNVPASEQLQAQRDKVMADIQQGVKLKKAPERTLNAPPPLKLKKEEKGESSESSASTAQPSAPASNKMQSEFMARMETRSNAVYGKNDPPEEEEEEEWPTD